MDSDLIRLDWDTQRRIPHTLDAAAVLIATRGAAAPHPPTTPCPTAAPLCVRCAITAAAPTPAVAAAALTLLTPEQHHTTDPDQARATLAHLAGTTRLHIAGRADRTETQ